MISTEKVPGYADHITLENVGILSGKFTKDITPGDDNLPWDAPIIQAFLSEQDLIQIRMVSTCIGFVKTLTKNFKDKP